MWRYTMVLIVLGVSLVYSQNKSTVTNEKQVMTLDERIQQGGNTCFDAFFVSDRPIDRDAEPLRLQSATGTEKQRNSLLRETFEGAFPNNNWATTDTWGTTTQRACEGNTSAYCAQTVVPAPGPYQNNMFTWMITKRLDLSNCTDAGVDYSFWADTELHSECGYDFFFVGASIDGENFNGTIYCGFWECTDELLDLKNVPNLGNLCGQSEVYIGFLFRSDNSQTMEGVYFDNIDVWAQGGCDPAITVTQPNGGEVWMENSTQQITWNSDCTSENIWLLYSVNGGNSWQTIVRPTADDGVYDWDLPEVDGDQNMCLVKAVDNADLSVEDISDANFTITDDAPVCQLAVTTPNGGEVWTEGTTHAIRWTPDTEIDHVNLLYITDNGAGWSIIVNGTNDDGAYSWTLPQVDQDENFCKVRVEDSQNPGICFDESDDVFSILDKPCTITLTGPNGGEVLMENNNYTVRWTSVNTSGNLILSYSTDNGVSWNIIIASTADDGEHVWLVPEVEGDKPDCLVRIEDVENPQCFDQSDGVFTIQNTCDLQVVVPNGGEFWQPDAVRTIVWTPVVDGGQVNIDYSADGGISWNTVENNTPDDGLFEWRVPAINTNQALISVTSPGQAGCTDVSDAVFSIGDCKAPSLRTTDIKGLAGEVKTVDILLHGNTAAISAFGFDLVYNTAHLSFQNITKGSLTADWIQVDAAENTPGVVRVGGFHSTPIPAGSDGSIAKMTFEVTCGGCAEGDQSPVYLQNLIDDAAGLNICSGYFEYGTDCILGDVNMDGNVSPADALCAFQAYMNGGIFTEGSGCDTECAPTSADATCDGQITPQDALNIFQAYMNGTLPECPPLQSGKKAISELQIADVAGIPGAKIKIPVTVGQNAEPDAFGFDVRYAPDLLTFAGFETGAVTKNWRLLDVVDQNGRLRIGGCEPDARRRSKGRELLTLVFEISPRAGGLARLHVLELKDDLAGARVDNGSVKTGVDGWVPDDIGLAQNFPNPFNASTELLYRLPQESQVQLAIYDVTGRAVKVLADGVKQAGIHRIVWDGYDDSRKEMPSGIYFAVMRCQKVYKKVKMVMIK